MIPKRFRNCGRSDDSQAEEAARHASIQALEEDGLFTPPPTHTFEKQQDLCTLGICMLQLQAKVLKSIYTQNITKVCT